MFERYTERARRVIFFARFEASQYGSPRIETEHLLLGVVREGRGIVNQLCGPDVDEKQIRAEIEKVITKGKRIPTSVEVPLSEESQRVLQLATEEADKLGSQHVGIEHILLGLFRVGGSLAVSVLNKCGADEGRLRKRVASSYVPGRVKTGPQFTETSVAKIYRFIAGLQSNDPGGSGLLFAENAQVVDSDGKRWRGQKEIEKDSGRLFVAYANENVTSILESVDAGPCNTLIASVVWENVIAEDGATKSMHRMSMILGDEGNGWVVFFLQMTPIIVR